MSNFMARVLGESGRYVSEEATKRFRSVLSWGIFGMTGLGVLLGFVLGGFCAWTTFGPARGGMLSVALVLAVVLMARAMFRRVDELQAERETMRKGARGEDLVGLVLSMLPDEFCVIHDVATRKGNLDHVVVGPTGVFVIETKNWRGVVGADGHGELTCNGKGMKTGYVRRFVGRMMAVREKVLVLAPEVEVYFNAVMVFTSAWVEAGFGTTGSAHCLRDDRLQEYIVEDKGGRKLSAREIDLVSRAFASLARMDEGFERPGAGALDAESSGGSGQEPVVAVGAR